MSYLYVCRDEHDKDSYHLYIKKGNPRASYWHVATMFIDSFSEAFDLTGDDLEKIGPTTLSPAPFKIVRKEQEGR